jgi:protein involved in polysaccharide export with SLBB domain
MVATKFLNQFLYMAAKQDGASDTRQEEFEINVKNLTFETAKQANNAPYPRQVMVTGNGSKANVFDESKLLKTNLPKTTKNPKYLLGIGDQLKFIQLNEYDTNIAHWPALSKKSEYVLGVGDELNFIQSADTSQDLTGKINDKGQFIPDDINDEIIETRGVIGSNGTILMFGLGKIVAANRTLEELRTEVRNILIRNGLTPNFQLEISNFQSKKAFVTINNNKSKSIPLNNLQITLKELALESGLSVSNRNLALVNLTRNEQEFRFTASQLFDLTAPEIIIQDNDHIEIQTISNKAVTIQSIVGSKGNILLGNVGNISAANRTLDDIYEEVRSILIKKGIKPNFQLEVTKFASKKAYLIQKNIANIVIPLTNSNITLRELIIENSSLNSDKGLTIVTLNRNGKTYRMTWDQILDPKTPDILVINDDQIEVERLNYKLGKVFALSGAGSAEIIPISPSKRETLADILFTAGGALNNLLAKRSEIYLLRGQTRSVAYHLDAQNVSRILVAAKTELRPNDIIYVADRPIISFSRTLAEILPLRLLLRDIQTGDIP